MEKDVFIFPVSFAQQRLWFLDQLEPGNAVYNVSTALRLRGPLQVTALEQSLHEIVRRHETLRTTFAVVDGNPVQCIAPYPTVTLPVVDLLEEPATEREAQVHRLITEETQRSFDLARGPLMRTTLFRLGTEEHILVLALHHIISDGWSRRILLRELAVLYEAFATQKPSPLTELPIQYADFAVWQRQWLQGAVLDTQLAYWQHQLAGAPAVLEVPHRLAPSGGADLSGRATHNRAAATVE